jgi:hypothetical protein
LHPFPVKNHGKGESNESPARFRSDSTACLKQKFFNTSAPKLHGIGTKRTVSPPLHADNPHGYCTFVTDAIQPTNAPSISEGNEAKWLALPVRPMAVTEPMAASCAS